MQLQKYMENLCSELDIKSPHIEAGKPISLAIHPDYIVEIVDLDPGFALQSHIGPLKTEKKEDLFTYLMRANFLGQGTGGARIGLSADEKSLTLSLGFSYELDYQSFKETIEDFVNYVAYWRSAIISQTVKEN